MTLDKRLNAYRNDLANRRLEGQVEATRFVDAKQARVSSPFLDLKAAPFDEAGLDTQVLHGQAVDVFEKQGDWCWVQAKRDGYVGYAKTENLSFDIFEPTHMVLAPRTFCYLNSDLKSRSVAHHSMGALLRVIGEAETRGTHYYQMSDETWVIKNHLIKIGVWHSDPVAVAETLLHTPYLWGGATGFGIDCAGLVQLSHMLCGNTVLRDSDMQSTSIGKELSGDPGALRRGDLVFWKGHVGIMADNKNLLHANGHTMNTALEPLADAIERIGYLYGQPTVMRRP